MRRGQPAQVVAARDQHQTRGRAGQQRPHLVGVAGVVEHDQHPLARQPRAVERAERVLVGGHLVVRHAERVQEPGEDRVRRDRRPGGVAVQVDVEVAVGEAVGGAVGPVPRERGLADPGRPGDGRHDHLAALGQIGEGVQPGELGLAADQLRDRRHLPGDGSAQLVVQPAQLGARLDAAVVDEDRAQPLVGAQRVGAAAGAVEGDHQLTPRRLPQRVLLDVAPQVVDHLGVPAERELRVDPVLRGGEAQLGHAPHDAGDQRRRRDVGQRRAVPHGEGLVEELRRALGVAGSQCRPPLFGPPDEHECVEVVVADDQPVPGGDGHERLGAGLAERATDPQHVPVDLCGCGPRRPVAPQLEEQLVDREHVARADEQGGEQGAGFRGVDLAPAVAVVHGDAAQDPIPHTASPPRPIVHTREVRKVALTPLGRAVHHRRRDRRRRSVRPLMDEANAVPEHGGIRRSPIAASGSLTGKPCWTWGAAPAPTPVSRPGR